MNKNEIRNWAVNNGLPIAKRGRIGKDVTVAYLRANPALARATARDNGIPVGTRGRIGPEVFEAVAEVI
jgi:hypothetical protein